MHAIATGHGASRNVRIRISATVMEPLLDQGDGDHDDLADGLDGFSEVR